MRAMFAKRNGALPLPAFLAFFALVTVASGFSNSFIPAFLVSLALPDYMFGLVYATASFMIFAFSPLWGWLSERIGRTRVIAAGCLGAACGQFLFCTAEGALQIVAARCVTGFFAGGFLVGCLSYSADLCEREGTSVPMAASAVAEGTASALAYLLGGLAACRTIRWGFGCQIALYLLAGLYALLAMPEASPTGETLPPARAENPASSSALAKLRSLEPWNLCALGSVLIAACGGWMFESAFNYSISAFFALPPLFNGVLKCGVGVLNALLGAGVIRRLIRRGSVRGPLLLVGALCVATSLLGAANAERSMPFFLVSICFLLINSLNLPLHQALITSRRSRLAVGEFMGLFNASRSVGQVLGSVMSGFSYGVRHALPFCCAAACFALMVTVQLLGGAGDARREEAAEVRRRRS